MAVLIRRLWEHQKMYKVQEVSPRYCQGNTPGEPTTNPTRRHLHVDMSQELSDISVGVKMRMGLTTRMTKL